MLEGAIRWMLKENGDNLDKFLSEKGIGLNLDYESANNKEKKFEFKLYHHLREKVLFQSTFRICNTGIAR